MIPTYVTPDKHNIKAIPRAFLLSRLLKPHTQYLDGKINAWPAVAVLWLVLSWGGKNKKNSYFTDVVIHTGDQCLIKKKINIKKKDFLDSRNVVCGYLQPLYAHRRFTTPPLGMTQIHTPAKTQYVY